MSCREGARKDRKSDKLWRVGKSERLELKREKNDYVREKVLCKGGKE